MANTQLRFRESTQFPPLHQGTTYVISYTDESGLTNQGLYQTYDLNTNELLSQYVITEKYARIDLSTLHTIEDGLQIIKSHL